LLADHELRPCIGGGDVDRCELPDRALSALESSDVEAVDPDELTRPRDIDVLLRSGISGWLIRCRVASDQPETLRPGVQPVTAQNLPHTVRGDHDGAPLLP
jgi:hypothetical protein